MARPKKNRRIGEALKARLLKPQGKPDGLTDIKGDELEAMRLCDVKALFQEKAARSMGVSRRTLERILDSGRKKVAEALISGKAIKISFPEYVTFK